MKIRRKFVTYADPLSWLFNKRYRKKAMKIKLTVDGVPFDEWVKSQP